MQKKAARLDLTQGPISPLIVRYALPLCIGMILQQLYSTVDTLVIGNFGGTTSLAAIGTSAQPIEILLCVFLGLGSGVSILVAQSVGSQDMDHLKRVTRNAITLMYYIGIPLSAIGFLLGPVILSLMQVPADTMAPAIAYIQVMFLGTLGALGYNMNAGVLRGLGASRATLYFLVISCLTNIVLDLLFVAGLGLDVAGAAWATIISQFVSWITSAAYLRKKFPETTYSLKPIKMDPATLKEILRIGIPLGLNSSIYSVGHVVLQVLVNTQGSAFMAACSVANRVNSLANMAINAMAAAANTFAGQNLGAKKYRRLVAGSWRIPLLSGVVTLAAGLLVCAFARPILLLFRPEPEVLEMAITYVQIVLPFFWTFAVFNSMMNYSQGLGVVRYSTVVNLVMLWVVRIPVACVIVFLINGRYVMAAYPISFTVGMLSMAGYFLTDHWRRIRMNALQEKMGGAEAT